MPVGPPVVEAFDEASAAAEVRDDGFCDDEPAAVLDVLDDDPEVDEVAPAPFEPAADVDPDPAPDPAVGAEPAVPGRVAGDDDPGAVDDGRVVVELGCAAVELGRVDVELGRGVVLVGRVVLVELVLVVDGLVGVIGAMPGAAPDPNRQPTLLPCGAGIEAAPIWE